MTVGGRPAFVINVEVFLHRDGRWLFIKRGEREAHAPGTLGAVGGKVDAGGVGEHVLEETARREVAEEVGVDLSGVELTYAGSSFFVTDDGDPVINVVLTAEMPADGKAYCASTDEVEAVYWLSLAEILADPACPPWTRRNLRSAAAVAAMEQSIA